MRSVRILAALALAGACVLAAGPAAAQATLSRGAQTQQISELQAAQLLFQNGHMLEAERVLLDLVKTRPDDPEALFLLGQIAMAENDPGRAIHDFRRILVRQPDAVRVRLELGRAFFVKKDYDNAERQFRLALAGKLADAVRQNIQVFLNAIRLQRRWSYNLSAALAPDTDINAGPSVQTVDIFGLPFQLSAQTRKHSGVGLTGAAGGEWSPHIGGHVWLRAGGEVGTSDYRQSMFDDTTVSGYAGLRFIAGKWDVSPLASYFQRWYGGKFYNRGAGGSLQATYYLTQRVALNASVSAQYVDYASPPDQSGPSATATMAALYTFSPTSFVSGQVSVARQWAEFPAYANTAVQLQVGYYRDLSRGISISVQPSWVRIAYAAPFAAFGIARVDNLWGVQATLLDRRLDVAGFTPRLLYAYTLNASNLPLYAYHRSRFEIGVTHTF